MASLEGKKSCEAYVRDEATGELKATVTLDGEAAPEFDSTYRLIPPDTRILLRPLFETKNGPPLSRVAMSHTLPAAPAFGEVLPLAARPEVLAFLARRRSASALSLQAPGPSDDELTDLLTLAARAPDHGKLAPWRFIILRGEDHRNASGRTWRR
jgi:hypothetical protein